MFVQQEKLPDRLTSSAGQWRNNIACSSSPSSVFMQQSRHGSGRWLPLVICGSVWWPWALPWSL